VRRRQPQLARVLLAATAVALALGPSALTAEEQAVPTQPPVFSAGVEVVRLDVIVLDREGRPVPGLAAADFTVEEDGREQSISSFEAIRVVATGKPSAEGPPRVAASRARAPEDGRCVFLFYDDVHVSPPVAERVRASLRRFLDEEVREGDWITLMAPDKQVWWTARTGWEYRQLVKVVDGLKGLLVRDPFRDGISDWEAVCMEEYRDRAQCGLGPSGGAAPAAARRETFQPVVPGGGATGSRIGDAALAGQLVNDEIAGAAKRRIAVTLDGLRQALDSLVPLRGHKSVVLVSEAFVLLPRMTGYGELIDAARRANVAIHFLDPRGLESGFAAEFQDAPPTFFGTRRELDAAGTGDLADATGGHSIAGNDPVAGLRRVAAESEAYYLLGYSPDAPRPGERKVRVKVAREGLTVRARARYYVEREEEAARAASRRRKADEQTGFDASAVAAMRSVSDATDLPLRAATLFFDANARGEVATLVATEVAPGPGRRRIRVAAEARRAEGGTPVREQFEETVDAPPDVPVVLARQWRLPAGVWQVRVLVQDVKSGNVGTAVYTFEVPDPKAFRLSTPLLTNAIEEEAGGARPRLTLGRAFPPEGRLYCQFGVHGAAGGRGAPPRVTSSWELRRQGALLHQAPPTAIEPSADGALARLFGLSLEGAPPGEYSLTLRVTDEGTGEILVRTEEFTVS
jgi:VWFA-related protein